MSSLRSSSPSATTSCTPTTIVPLWALSLVIAHLHVRIRLEAVGSHHRVLTIEHPHTVRHLGHKRHLVHHHLLQGHWIHALGSKRAHVLARHTHAVHSVEVRRHGPSTHRILVRDGFNASLDLVSRVPLPARRTTTHTIQESPVIPLSTMHRSRSSWEICPSRLVGVATRRRGRTGGCTPFLPRRGPRRQSLVQGLIINWRGTNGGSLSSLGFGSRSGGLIACSRSWGGLCGRL